MSAVYSYDAARRHDHMIERATLGLDITLKEMRPEVAAVFSAFPSRMLALSSNTCFLLPNLQFSACPLGSLVCASREFRL